MARKNPYDAPAPPPLGGPTPLGGPAIQTGPPADDQTEVALRRSRGKGVLPVDDETNFGDLESAIAGGGELEAEVLKVDPRALARRLASGSPEETASTASGRARGLADDEPTLLGGPAPVASPKELARMLAEQAKARMNAQAERASSTPEPPRQADPAPIDPAALARRLAAEAKARLQLDTTRAPHEDPAALARRLAAEAKARLTPQPAQPRSGASTSEPAPDRGEVRPDTGERTVLRSTPQPPPTRTPPPAPPRGSSTPRPAASRAATPSPAPQRSTPPPAPQRSTPSPAPSRATPSPAPSATGSRKSGRLADRAPRPPARTSAAEALKRYTDEPAPERQVLPPRPPLAEVVELSDSPASEPSDSALEPTPLEPSVLGGMGEVSYGPPESDGPITAPAPPPRQHDPSGYLACIAELLPDAIIESERPVRRPSVFKALWEAHQARAVKDGHLELAGAATLLLARVSRLQSGELVGVKITRAGKGWAVFVDAAEGTVLAIVPRPEVYLAGLQ